MMDPLWMGLSTPPPPTWGWGHISKTTELLSQRLGPACHSFDLGHDGWQTGTVRQDRRHGPSITVQNHTLLGHSPRASQAGRRVGPALQPSASLVKSHFPQLSQAGRHAGSALYDNASFMDSTVQNVGIPHPRPFTPEHTYRYCHLKTSKKGYIFYIHCKVCVCTGKI